MSVVTSAKEVGYVLAYDSSVCLPVCPLGYSESCQRILMKFLGGVRRGTRTN